MRIFFVLFLLAACGSDSDSKPVAEVEKPVGVAEVPEALASDPEVGAPGYPQSLYIAAGDELPACGDENERQLIYDAEVGEFRVCRSRAWSIVDIGSRSVDRYEFTGPKKMSSGAYSLQVDSATLERLPAGQFHVVINFDYGSGSSPAIDEVIRDGQLGKIYTRYMTIDYSLEFISWAADSVVVELRWLHPDHPMPIQFELTVPVSAKRAF
jgi:hypothetical protein